MGDQGFLASLFDISFSSLITTKVIKGSPGPVAGLS